MPSFDIVSNVDNHELSNAVDQANREVDNRFDFKGSGAKFVLAEDVINLSAPNDFQLKQMADILNNKMAARKLDVQSLDYDDPEVNLSEARQKVDVKQGIDTPTAKKIIKMIKDKKLKVQTAIQGEQVRVTGKKRDDLQSVIALLKEDFVDLPLQYENFRD